MGEIADMMLGGALCAHCGVALTDSPPDGVPRWCRSCRNDGHAMEPPPSAAADGNMYRTLRVYECVRCRQRFTSRGGARDHFAAKHAAQEPR